MHNKTTNQSRKTCCKRTSRFLLVLILSFALFNVYPVLGQTTINIADTTTSLKLIESGKGEVSPMIINPGDENLPGPAQSISGASTVCKGQAGVVYTTSYILNATGYLWKLPLGATITSGNNTRSITVQFSSTASSGVITVTGTNQYGYGAISPSFAVTVNTVPSSAGAITGTSTVCQGQTQVAYSVAPIPGATSYSWTVPTGATVVSGNNTNSILVDYSRTALNGNITVKGVNSCGNGTVSPSLAVSVSLLPVQAGAITGTSTVCAGQNSVAYSVPVINNATGYSWALPTGATIASGSNTNSITVNFSTSAVSGNISVNGTNSCGNGIASANIAVTVNPLPIKAGSITGPTTSCKGQTGVVFSVPSINHATGYLWTVPTGASITSGSNTNIITVNFSPVASSGNVTVRGTNSCGSGVSSSKWISVQSTPNTPGAITGAKAVSPGQEGVTYSVPTTSNATTYEWFLPPGASITSGNNTRTITVKFAQDAASGNMSVRGLNSCGFAGATSASYPVTVVPPRAASSDKNYVRSRTILKKGVLAEKDIECLLAGEVQETIIYYDGLGRPRQSVDWQASPLKKDIITPVEYDAYGRESKKYLPYAVNTENNGAYVTGDYNSQAEFYSGMYTGEGSSAISRTVYEVSPLNRVLKQGAPGSAWQPDESSTTRTSDEHVVSYDYETNTATEVRLWIITGKTVSGTSYYNKGTLYKTLVIDENNNKVMEYKDMLGNVILKKVESDSGYLDTYYVFDDYNRLRYVLPSLAKALTYSEINDLNFNELVYAYHYDSRGRLVEKHLPGAGWQEIVYNAIDLPVLSRDQKQIDEDTWTFTKYDALGRPVITGLLGDTACRVTMQNLVNAQAVLWEMRTDSTYTKNSFPKSGYVMLTENYYDDYSFKTSKINFQSALGNTSFSNFTKGLLTGTKVKTLGEKKDSLYSIIFYDNYSRPIQVFNKTIRGDWDRISNSYDFAGQVLQTERVYKGTKILNRYVYDHAGRKKEVYQKMNLEAEVMLASYNYDELGQLIEKNLHQTSTERLQSVDYRYNIRGWLTSINNSKLNADPSVGSESDDAFGMNLYYTDAFTAGSITSKEQYNGNISGMAWKTKGPGVAYTSVPSSAYAFNYDKLNRLELANYATSPTSNDSYNTYDGRYNESLTYDVMGNIKTLSRKGMQGLLDNLSYTYLEGGHKLGKVTDATTDAAGFNDLNKTDDDYAYDVNGNLTIDNNKNLGIAYNMLNLPVLVTRASDSIKYVYDATGRKLKKVHDGVNHHYIDGIEYSDDNLLFIATEEGRVRKHETTGSWVYDYFLKDHLGNVRVVLTAAPPTIDAYPAATMETLETATEETFYANLPETRTGKPLGFDSNPDTNPGNREVAELGPIKGKQVGPSITLKVNAGDKLTLSAKSFYNSQASYTRDQLLPEMLLMLLDGLMNPSGLTGQTGTVAREAANYQVFGSSNSYSSALSSIANNVYNSTEAKPKAFMVWMLFDNEFNLVKSSSGMLQVGAAGAPAKTMFQDNLVMDRGGYFYAYLVNESPVSVYFDDFQVTHVTGKVLEENHYYPFGMLNAQLSTQPTDKPLNYYKYNSKEMQKELNLEWLDYGARFYDAQVGRWHGVDPLAHKMPSWSLYSFCFNNPLIFIDPTGAIPTPVEGARIAGHIYDGKIGDVLDGGWRLDKVYTSKDNPAYRSGLYSRTVDGVTEYAMANAGTYFENSKRGRGSMSEDVEQPLGGSENMKVSISTARKLSEQIGSKELTFVGHSKGGAEATGNALATNRNALLYNPAAINAEAYGLDPKSYTGADKNGMTAFVVKGDMLNSFINQFFAKPIDKAVYLPQQSKNPVTNHLIDTMIKALQQHYKTFEHK